MTPTGELESSTPEQLVSRFQEGFMIDSLYETIGGRRTVSAAVESFYRRVLADITVRHFFSGVNMEHLRTRQSMFVSMLLGGQIVYTGREITTAHAGSREQGLNDTHFDTILLHFRASLEEVGVDPEKVEKIIVLLEGTRNAVLKR
jgi:truncated hemoglobin YjbI